MRRLSTPRAAGLAGVLFAVLFGVAIALIHTALPEGAQPGAQWVEGSEGKVRAAAVLMPFAGICFLWFIGVVRDGLGRYEDKFFASVFLGSGLLFLAMIFVSSAVGVALVASRGADYGADVHVFGQALLIALSKTGCVNPIWDHDDGLTGTHLAPANHALGLGGHCRVARAIGICRPDRGYRFRALGGLHRRGAQPRCREVL